MQLDLLVYLISVNHLIRSSSFVLSFGDLREED